MSKQANIEDPGQLNGLRSLRHLFFPDRRKILVFAVTTILTAPIMIAICFGEHHDVASHFLGKLNAIAEGIPFAIQLGGIILWPWSLLIAGLEEYQAAPWWFYPGQFVYLYGLSCVLTWTFNNWRRRSLADTAE